VAEPRPVDRQPGWREVLIVAAAVVAIVLGAAFLTSVLPTGAQEVVFHTPLAIVVLVAVVLFVYPGIYRGSSNAPTSSAGPVASGAPAASPTR